MSRQKAILGLLAAGLLVGGLSVRYLPRTGNVPPPQGAVEPPAPPTPKLIKASLPILPGDTFDEILVRAGLSQDMRTELTSAFTKVFDVRKIKAGKELILSRWDLNGILHSLEYGVDPDHRVVLKHTEGNISGEMLEIPGTISEVPVCGVLEDSLFASFERIGERPEVLATQMADVLAFDIDFYRDPQPGDRFCVLVEKKFYDNGQPPTYRRMLAASYTNMGTTHEAFWYTPPGESKGTYYSGDGRSLQSAFLRSPLEFDARISSHFARNRLHPVLHVNRAHLGTDYAAPTGTPVRAVAAGRVSFSGYSGGNGNLITIEHQDGYRTQYLHLSRRIVRTGARVEQGQRIGLVGSTGLATGPHLDIRISRNGKYMDWERLRSPRTIALSAQQKQAFEIERDRLSALIVAAPDPVVAEDLTGGGIAGF